MLMVVATVLDRLPQPVVYTGGATIPLYLDALSARDMRPSDSESEVRTFITAWVRTERKNLDTMAPAFLAASDRLAGRDKLLLETIDLMAGLRLE
jgi:hypothetical protein